MPCRRFNINAATTPAVWRRSNRALYARCSGFRYATTEATADAGEVTEKTLEAGENNTGHIYAGPNQGVLFFNSKTAVSCLLRYATSAGMAARVLMF